jgi:hypothetical protein
MVLRWCSVVGLLSRWGSCRCVLTSAFPCRPVRIMVMVAVGRPSATVYLGQRPGPASDFILPAAAQPGETWCCGRPEDPAWRLGPKGGRHHRGRFDRFTRELMILEAALGVHADGHSVQLSRVKERDGSGIKRVSLHSRRRVGATSVRRFLSILIKLRQVHFGVRGQRWLAR